MNRKKNEQNCFANIMYIEPCQRTFHDTPPPCLIRYLCIGVLFVECSSDNHSANLGCSGTDLVELSAAGFNVS